MEKLSKVVEGVEVEVLEVLSNGVERYDLESFPSDESEAQRVLEQGTIGDYVDAYANYSTRVNNDFVGIYKVRLESTAEYQRFCKMLSNFMYENQTFFAVPTFENWKTNKIDVGNGRIMKLGKHLKSKGVEQSILDFYSQQPKIDTKDYFLVISDRIQDIAGMTYYAKNWDSCQNTNRDDVEYNHCLAGSLYDDKLFIAYIVENVEDLEDMEDKMLCRVNMRYVRVDSTPFLIPSRIYGTNITQRLMKDALRLVEEKHILSNDFRDTDNTTIALSEDVDSTVEINMYDEIYVEVDEYIDVEITCPLCDGSGEYEVYSHKFDKHIDIECPTCHGSGEYSTEVSIYVSEHVEIEDTMMSKSYTDDYMLSNRRMSIRVDEELLIAHFDKYLPQSTFFDARKKELAYLKSQGMS